MRYLLAFVCCGLLASEASAIGNDCTSHSGTAVTNGSKVCDAGALSALKCVNGQLVNAGPLTPANCCNATTIKVGINCPGGITASGGSASIGGGGKPKVLKKGKAAAK